VKEERIVVVHWEGPFEWEQSQKRQKHSHVLYAFYGSHHLYGRDVLLYIGRSDDTENRIKQHAWWIEWEYDTIKVRLASVFSFPGWAEFEKLKRYPKAKTSLVADVEALLIFAHTPAYNTMGKGDLANAGLRILNTGKLGHLLPEVSSLYYAV
jgi:hypothetical protein